MFLVSKSRSGKSELSWRNLARIGVGVIILFSLLLDLLTTSMKLDTITVGGLFLSWGILTIFANTFWRRSARVARIVAFVDLFFSIAVVVFCHGLSLVWLPALFILPTLELSSLYGTAGIVFILIAFAWTIILSGLMNLPLFQQPVWWIVALLWGTFLLFVATLQAMRLGYMRNPALLTRKQTISAAKGNEQQEAEPEEEGPKLVQGRLAVIIPQIAAAFELPFRHMGVHTEEYRQEIEDAINALYDVDADQEALSLCLDRLLQAAKQNWVGLAAFSPREQEILELLLQDCTYKEMSSRLYVSPSTIKSHIYHIFQKLDVSNRDEATRLIHKRGWFSVNQHAPLLLDVSSR